MRVIVRMISRTRWRSMRAVFVVARWRLLVHRRLVCDDAAD